METLLGLQSLPIPTQTLRKRLSEELPPPMASSIMAAVSRGRTAATSAISRGAVLVEEQYAKTMKENAQYVLNDPQKEKVLLQQWFFTKLSK